MAGTRQRLAGLRALSSARFRVTHMGYVVDKRQEGSAQASAPANLIKLDYC